ncbi:cytochrome b/b6 domain-containing protein [Bradyrhizobium sp. ISRA443]|uniref:cytochrome b/b6 domain-containing protein n=1 Tax=unclassified Bradyrhizobium TaxID=2631580 RepID=UPI00247980BF|nr:MULTISPECIES: cytochrome b/b6 domain-containing protein [unclassified Bradyrhizobium]WGR94700.1 cytochrome b/b6 domain-containing protein [Bradyrhizobium sp. ISRA435]WGR99515.1 cytochrome b/b6 domain-containing protein [Bradyrhizobium sp. ISRA436]WGS06405.1 cytochrome b/b6 domain-containing protein [Bradyrhizobium sp. ISRA437]WGS13289.1 cytochrome b/b6 domain-containing protein [Bradyrhizobium sp. ISRA443]
MAEAAPGPRDASTQRIASRTVQVWDLPLRLWHWTLAAAVLVAWFTPNSHDRLHRLAGYSVIGLLAFRLIWGFAGTRYSQFKMLGARLRAAPRYLWNLRHGVTGRYIGLNPAGTVMLVALLVLLAISAITGAMQVTVTFFGVWWVEDTHAYASDAVIILVVLHVLGVVVMGILQRQNLVQAMITGRKLIRSRW